MRRPRHTLLVSYDLSGPKRDYKELIEELKNAPAWWHYLESVWIIKTERTADAWSKSLMRLIDEDDSLLILEITISDSQGWLPEKAWKWIEKNCEEE